MKTKTIIYETLGYLFMVSGIYNIFCVNTTLGVSIGMILVGQLFLWRERLAENNRVLPIKRNDWKVLFAFGAIFLLFAFVRCSESNNTVNGGMQRYEGFGIFLASIYLIISGYIRFKRIHKI